MLHMLRTIKWIFSIAVCLHSFSIAYAANHTIDSTLSLSPGSQALTVPTATPIYKMANIAYVTFRVACEGGGSNGCSNTANNAFLGECPTGLILVGGSQVNVPSIAGVPESGFIYWQCLENLNTWGTQPGVLTSGKSPQPFTSMNFNSQSYVGTQGSQQTSPPLGVYQAIY
jgi:hypothetical protein